MARFHPVWLALANVLLLVPCSSIAGQSIEARAGRFFDADGWTTYRIGLRRPLAGVLGLQLHGDLLKSTTSEGGMAGMGADLTAFRAGSQGPHLLSGLGGGLGSPTPSGLSPGGGAWAGGVGGDGVPGLVLLGG